MTRDVPGVVRSMSSPVLAHVAIEGTEELLLLSTLDGGSVPVSVGKHLMLSLDDRGSIVSWRPIRRPVPGT